MKFIFLFCILFLGCKKEEHCVCAEIYKPVCAGGKIYHNECVAKCNGFKDYQIKSPIDNGGNLKCE